MGGGREGGWEGVTLTMEGAVLYALGVCGGGGRERSGGSCVICTWCVGREGGRWDNWTIWGI